MENGAYVGRQRGGSFCRPEGTFLSRPAVAPTRVVRDRIAATYRHLPLHGT